jgi:hypothetical protein
LAVGNRDVASRVGALRQLIHAGDLGVLLVERLAELEVRLLLDAALGVGLLLGHHLAFALVLLGVGLEREPHLVPLGRLGLDAIELLHLRDEILVDLRFRVPLALDQLAVR